MEFPLEFANWIKAFITSSQFSIKNNGGLCGWFFKSKGLRKGDPLSPYLFVISMEVFSYLLNDVVANGSLPYQSKCKQLSITYLCFTDDLLVFSNGSSQSIQAITDALHHFCTLFGLSFNSNKSEIFCLGISDNEALQLQ